MRIDREGFLLAVAALAGCERADTSSTQPPPVTPPAVQRPGMATHVREAVPAPEPPPPAPAEPIPVVKPEPAPPPAPKRVSAHRRQSPKSWFLGLSMSDRTNVTSVCQQRAEISCRAALRVALPTPTPPPGEDPVAPAEPEADSAEQKVARLPSANVAAYCQNEFPAPTCETPLVVAFDGQPIEFTPAGRDPFAFVPGEPAATDWPSQETPWIALDVDGDGAITTGAELFGSSTVLASGALAPNGFAALDALDAIGDGTVDARDPMFSRLVLWSDRNGDHRSTPDELRPLGTTVTAISLAFTRDPRCNDRDDCEGERGTLRWRDTVGAEHTGAVVDVYIPRRR